MAKKILVTGGTGYIGSHTVVDLYNNGYEPIIIDNLSNSKLEVLAGIESIIGVQPKFYNADCNDLNSLLEITQKEGEIFGIIHFAAFKSVGESVVDPLKYYKSNIQCLVNVLELMDIASIKNLVFSSTCAVYGNPKELPVSELEAIETPTSPYGNTKKIAEEIIVDFCKAKRNINATILRYFNPFGAHYSGEIGEHPNGIPANIVPIILQTATGQRDSFSVFGNDYATPDGTCIRDYIDIMDLSSAHVKALQWLSKIKSSGVYETFNIGTGKGYSVLNLINTFENLTGIVLNYNIEGRRNGDIKSIYANATKANKALDWEASVTMEDSLMNAWKWQMKLSQ